MYREIGKSSTRPKLANNMHTNNPYAQAGWYNPANRNSINNSNWTPASGLPPQASIYGALPFAKPPSPQALLTFRFTSFNPSILNCIVLGPQEREYFRVVNDSPAVGCTMIQTAEGINFAVIEWRHSPIVEIRELVTRQNVAQWIGLSEDRTYRVMEARGRRYTWAPRENYICMYTAGPTPPELYARVSRRETSATLEITAQAVQMGLLETCIVAVVLLQCGRTID